MKYIKTRVNSNINHNKSNEFTNNIFKKNRRDKKI